MPAFAGHTFQHECGRYPNKGLNLKHRLSHLDAKRLGLVAPGNNAAVVQRQDHGGAAFERGPEHPLAGDEEVIAIDQARTPSSQALHHPADNAPHVGVFPVNGGEGPHGQFPVDSDNNNRVGPGMRERSTTRVSPARIPSPAMPSPSAVTKNVDAGLLMKCASRLRLVVGATTVNIEKVRWISNLTITSQRASETSP